MSRPSKSLKPKIETRGTTTVVSLGTLDVVIYPIEEPGRTTRFRATWWMRGCRLTQTKRSLPEAIEVATQVLTLRNTGKDEMTTITAEKLRYYQDCESALSVPLDVAVRYYVSQVGGRTRPMLVSDLVASIIKNLEDRAGKKGASEGWVSFLRQSANVFDRTFPGKMIHEILPDDIHDFLARPAWGQRTRFNHQQTVAALFREAKDAGAIGDGKTSFDLFKPKYEMPDEQEKKVLSPASLGKLLRTCLELGRTDFIPHVAVSAFGGVRFAEGARLRWGTHVDLEEKVIRLTSDITKTGRRRLVPIDDTLLEWLQLAPSQEKGELIQPYASSSEIFTSLWRDTARLPAWPRNALRVSFVSYAMAKTENAAAVANMAGHSEAMLQTVYKQIRGVSKKTAEEWFNIRPCQFSVS